MQVYCDCATFSSALNALLLKHNPIPSIVARFSNIMNIDPADYPRLTIHGPVSAKLIKAEEPVGDAARLLIVGPAGAGKSTFIEALAQDPSLRISSNQLEGFTQSVNTYSLMNVKRHGQQILLVDVPGFADTRISMMNIVSMLKEWMQESGAPDLGRILYFTPIHTAGFGF
ncbi:hypothetical protein BJ165DRAFT_1509756 [Panaeolus papilionaceus]|nr:hypothetical protein BJ165DRAFT_1509756 [Panaeolus papilionaceus]